MPLYDFRCPAQHITEVNSPSLGRPATVPCPYAGCDHPAAYVPGGVAKAKPGPDAGWKLTDKRSNPSAWHDYACRACDHEDLVEVQVSSGIGEGYDTQPLDCPSCGGERAFCVVPRINAEIALANAGRYFDRGLGCWIESPSHRKRLMKERGLVEADQMDFTQDAQARAVEDHHAKVERDYKAIEDQMEHAPSYAGYRRARDSGKLLDDLKKRPTYGVNNVRPGTAG